MPHRGPPPPPRRRPVGEQTRWVRPRGAPPTEDATLLAPMSPCAVLSGRRGRRRACPRDAQRLPPELHPLGCRSRLPNRAPRRRSRRPSHGWRGHTSGRWPSDRAWSGASGRTGPLPPALARGFPTRSESPVGWRDNEHATDIRRRQVGRRRGRPRSRCRPRQPGPNRREIGLGGLCDVFPGRQPALDEIEDPVRCGQAGLVAPMQSIPRPWRSR